ncbi:putative Alcohol dehydrogenase transcription factor Myb/SANT-like-containing protein 27, partial [Homarus americanus]
MSSNERWKWDSDKTMLLIQQYERFPELWNVSLMEYRKKEKKTNAIKEIAEILNLPESEITRKWHNLLCQMNSEMRKLKKKKSGIGADDVILKDPSFSQNVVNEEFTQPSEQCQDYLTPSTSGIEHDKKRC